MTTDLSALAVAVPLGTGAVLIAAGDRLHRRAIDGVALATAVGVAVLGALLLRSAPQVSWMGGWTPTPTWVPGIDLTADPAAAGVVLLAGLLASGSFLFAWRYFDSVGPLFHSLVLMMVGAMAGFALAGDLFNMFVWFELMGVCAYALTSYKVEEEGPVQAALNFGISNSVGALLMLVAIGLLYGRTGSLNLAEIGQKLAQDPPDFLVTTALGLLCTAFLVKAAIAPFHFWHADSHAAAPTPVTCLFSGLMVELGLFGLARVWWTVFSGVFPEPEAAIRGPLLALGAGTALLGGWMCFLQTHLKRLLAFSTISHLGLGMLGFGLLSTSGLTAAGLYLGAHGLWKGALFLAAGMVLHRTGQVEEHRLWGRGRDMPWTGAAFLVGGLGLAGMPPVGLWVGKEALDGAAETAGFAFLVPVGSLAAALTAGAVLRVWARTFHGWGTRPRPPGGVSVEPEDERETRSSPTRVPFSMGLAVGMLMAACLALGAAPPRETLESGGGWMADRALYAEWVLRIPTDPAPPPHAPLAHPKAPGLWTGVTLALAVLFAAAGLWPRPCPGGGLARGLRRLHSGLIGDYLAWLTLGTGLLCACFALAARAG